MTLSVQFVDGVLNAGWLLLAFAAWHATRHYRYRKNRSRAVLAFLCAAVLLFPIISISDDLVQQVQVYDTAASPQIGNSGKELKQISVLPRTVAVADSSAVSVSDLPFVQYIAFLPSTDPISLGGSTTGIHSPPAVL